MPPRLSIHGTALRDARDAGLASGVLLLCVLPWLNPFSAGPVASVVPWLVCAFAAVLAVLWSVALAGPGARVAGIPGAGWWPAGAAALLLIALWPRPALLPSYEALALAGGLALIGLGAVLARQAPAHAAIGGLPWGWWCALLPWAVAGLASSVLALLQYFGHAGLLTPWVNWAPAGEAFANLRQRNQFASLTSIALAALLAGGLLRPRRLSRAQGLCLALAMALLIAANAASTSRTGLLQIGVLVAVALLWRRDLRTLLWLAGMLGAYALAVAALPWIAGLDPDNHGMFARLRDGDRLCASRLTLWRNVLDLIAARPWLGWGWGELDYAHFITLYDGPRFCDILDNAHSLPLHLAVELGIPAAVLVCGAVLVAVLCGQPWREAEPARRAAWMVLAVLGVHSLLEYPLWYGPFQLALGLCLGLLWPTRAAGSSRPAGGHLRVWFAMLALCAAAYAAWDYRRISQIYLPPGQRLAAYRAETLAKLQASWLFRRQVQFAELSVVEPTPDNALAMQALATDMLHFSPEPRVIERLLASAQFLGLDTELAFYEARYKAAFPDAYAQWVAAQVAQPAR